MRVVAKGSGRKCGDGTSVGLFIPLPLWIARKFPTLIPDDSSPSHVTLLYIGEVTDPEEQTRLVEVLRKICGRFYWNSVRATLGEVSSFDHGERVVPHIQVEFSRDFASFRRLLRQELAQEGFQPEDKYVEYKPHVTLDYLDPDEEWGGKTPKGSWTFNKIEVWGLPDQVPKLQLGKVKTAYGPEQGMQGFEEVSKRLNRLRQAALAPVEIRTNLPSSAQFVWDRTDEMLSWLQDAPKLPGGQQASEVAKELISKIRDQRAAILMRAKKLDEARGKAWADYYNDMDKFLDALAQGILHIKEEASSLDVKPLTSVLFRMRDNNYPTPRPR